MPWARLDSWHRHRKVRKTAIWNGLCNFWSGWLQPSFHNEWLGERIAVIYNFIAMFTLAMVLLRYHNKPLSEWHAYITINTVMSILSTTARLSMVWIIGQTLGQAKWLHFSQRGPAPLFDLHLFDATTRGPWGATQMIWSRRSMLGTIGAFLTLTVLLVDPVSQELVTFPSIKASIPQILLYRIQNYDVPPKNLKGITQLGDSTLQQGVLSGTVQNPLQIRADCVTGDCQTGPFGSVGFCSACHSGVGRQRGNALTSPSNVTWQIDNNEFFNPLQMVFSDFPLIASFQYPIFGFAKATELPQQENGTETFVPFTECALTFCAKLYQLNVERGSQHVSILNHTIMGTRDTEVREAVTQPNLSDYTVANKTAKDILQYFKQSLTSTSSDLRISLVTSKNVTSLMTDLATSMSNALLRESGPSTLPVDGLMYTTTTIIHVRWPWLCLPVALVVATSLLLFVIIQRSHWHQDQTLWKSSILAPLFTKVEGTCPPPAPGHDSPVGNDSVGWLGYLMDIRHRAQHVTASLEKHEERWIFRMGDNDAFAQPVADRRWPTPYHDALRMRKGWVGKTFKSILKVVKGKNSDGL